MIDFPSPPAWTEQARCAQVDPEIFFPAKGGSLRPARAVCERCPVQAECFDYSIANGEKYGIWGGISEFDRRKLRRKGSAAA